MIQVTEIKNRLVTNENKTQLLVNKPTAILVAVAKQGPPGAPASALDSHYTHTQLAAASTWNIVHNLGKYPSVTIVDSGNNQVIGDVQFIDINTLTITFTSAFGGKAYIN